ncbi:MAG: hypothetical protein LBM87_03450 [Ruminococcus sp.]|jgi:uncharacterized protein YutE (UPF0331/DUF86 family)|nr:hypothetical protein [Ruminococcus sp.]
MKKFAVPIIVVSTVIIAAALTLILVLGGQRNTYEKVERESFRALTDSIVSAAETAKSPEKATDTYKNGITLDTKIQYEAAEQIAALLGMSKIDLSARIATDLKDKMGVDLSLNDSGESLTVAVFADAAGKMLVSFPGLTKYAVGMDLPADDSLKMIVGTIDEKLLEKDLNAIIDKYFEIYEAKAIEPDDFTLVAGELSKEVKRYEADFTERDVAELMVFTLETFRANSNLTDYCAEIYATAAMTTIEEAREEFLTELDDLIADAKDALESLKGETGDVMVKMTTYLLKGKIVGRKFTAPDSDGVIKYTILEDSNTGAFEASFTEGNSQMKAEADYTKNGKKYTGTGKITVDSITVNADFKDIELTEDGYGSGALTLSMNAMGTGGTINIDMSYKDTTQTMVITGEITAEGETIDIGKLTIDMTLNPYKDGDITEIDSANIIDADAEEIDQEKLAEMMTEIQTNMGNFESPVILTILELLGYIVNL